MSGYPQPSTIAIGSQILLGDDDANGVEWGFSTIDGWHKPVGVDVPRVQRIVSHGEFAQAGHRTGRVITVTGWLWAETRATINAALTQLSAVLADGGFDTFTFTDSDYLALSAEVQLLDLDADWETGTAENPPRYQLQLLAADPYKYGATSSGSTEFYTGVTVGQGLVFDVQPSLKFDLDFGATPTSTGFVTLTNAGTAPASVKFTVAGPTPADGFRITDQQTGQSISYLGGVVPFGSFLVFDGADGSVVLDGAADRSGDTIVEAWPVIEPGGSKDFLFAPISGTSAAVLTASTVSTYW